MWCDCLELINDLSDNSQFFHEWNLVLIVIKYHARNMSVLNNENILGYTSLKGNFG